MKKFLLIFIATILLLLQPLLVHSIVFAAPPVDTPTPTPLNSPGLGTTPVPTDDGKWVEDPDVTFVGKVGARASGFLDWALREYSWVKKANGKDDSVTLEQFWKRIYGIATIFLLVAIITTAFVMIITRGRSITFMRFLPRFALIVLLMTFSFYLIQFIYQFADYVQSIFLKNPDWSSGSGPDVPRTISQLNLLFIGFNYQDFQGFRLSGIAYDESVFVSLLLVKLTAATYYVMTGILILRKVILWFFIVISPVFPLLLLFAPVRNTAKIWIGEFFRWLLYAPIFAIFLGGLVALWRAGIPLNFIPPHQVVGTDVVYKTAINILLGGPGQTLSINNSVNLPETFALYVVALLMLWVVTLLPFLLLQIFLDYIATISLSDNNALKQIINSGFTYMNKNFTPLGPGPSSPPGSYQPTGAARSLPFANIAAKFAIPLQKPKGEALEVPRPAQRTSPQRTELLRLTNLSIPTMRDIARFETATLSKDISKHEEVAQVHEALERIANPALIGQSVDRAQAVDLRGRIIAESQQGNPVAQSILSAVSTLTPAAVSQNRTSDVLRSISNPTSLQNSLDRTKFSGLRERLVQESRRGNQVASTVLTTANKASQAATAESQTRGVLQRIANPASIQNTTEKQIFTQLKTELSEAKEKGNPIAATILAATLNSAQMQVLDVKKINTQLLEAKEKGDPLASSVLSLSKKTAVNAQEITDLKLQLKEAKEKGDTLASSILVLLNEAEKTTAAPASPNAFPQTNRVQEVSLDDYESVRKMWVENYQKLDVPQNIESAQKDRRSWLKEDVQKISATINLLVSQDQQKAEEGMKAVSNILPFLLIGGFSQTEVIAYLKAKLEAAKAVLADMEKKEEEEDTMVETTNRKEEKPKTMTTEAKAPEPTAQESHPADSSDKGK